MRVRFSIGVPALFLHPHMFYVVACELVQLHMHGDTFRHDSKQYLVKVRLDIDREAQASYGQRH
jgi:hypothetical protein